MADADMISYLLSFEDIALPLPPMKAPSMRAVVSAQNIARLQRFRTYFEILVVIKLLV